MAHFLHGKLVRAAVVLAAGLTMLPAGTAMAAGDDSLHLLPPTGPHAVGTTKLYLDDTSRPDPWVPTVASRELMVTLFYPTDARGGATAPYLSAEESKLILEGKHVDLPPDTLNRVRTNGILDARPSGRAHSLPLILLSAGHTNPRATVTGLAEDLASRGYVVAAIDHTYETYAVTFPDGRIATCAACAIDDTPEFFPKLYQVHAADVSFVLARLTAARHPAWAGSRLIDASRIGMAGHSSGGAAAIASMLADPRIDAGVDLDGQTRDAVPDAGFRRPFMFVGGPDHKPGGADPSWDHDFALMTGWKRWLTVAGVDHSSFTDLGVLADQLGIDIGATTSGARATDITRRYTAAMFDLNLRHRPQPLLDAPSSSYPEVTIAAR